MAIAQTLGTILTATLESAKVKFSGTKPLGTHVSKTPTVMQSSTQITAFLSPRRKLRGDATLARLNAAQRDCVHAWLYHENRTYVAVVQLIRAEFGLSTSKSALGAYYQRHILPGYSDDEDAEITTTLASLKAGHASPAILRRAKALAYFALARPAPQIHLAEKLLDALHRIQKQAIARRRLSLAQRRAAGREAELSARSIIPPISEIPFPSHLASQNPPPGSPRFPAYLALSRCSPRPFAQVMSHSPVLPVPTSKHLRARPAFILSCSTSPLQKSPPPPPRFPAYSRLVPSFLAPRPPSPFVQTAPRFPFATSPPRRESTLVRPLHLALLAATVSGAGLVRAASADESRIASLFRPLDAEFSALCPEGRRVAYTVREGPLTKIAIVDLDGYFSKRLIGIEPERGADTAADPSSAASPSPPAQLRFLRWASADRLVFAHTERILPLPPVTDAAGRTSPSPNGPTIVSPIIAVSADGKNRRTVADAHNFTESEDALQTLADMLRTPKELATQRRNPVHWRMPRLAILGFDPRDREQLILETSGAYSPPTQHAVDLRTGYTTLFGGEVSAPPSEPQVYDWSWFKIVGERQPAARPHTAWRDADLSKLQHALEAKFPRRTVELLDWTEARTRILFRVTGGTDAGRLFVYQRVEDLAVEVLQRAPWLPGNKLHPTRFFECAAPDGSRLTGYLTWPNGHNTAGSTPLIVAFPSGFPAHAQPAFDPESQVFADRGFAVLRLNHRCVAGIDPAHRPALAAALDRVSIGDAVTALAALTQSPSPRSIDRTRIVAFGRGFGGYLAVRALQLQPELFRAGIALDAPVALPRWLATPTPHPLRTTLAALIGRPEQETQTPLCALTQADTLRRPLLLLTDSTCDPAIAAASSELHERLLSLGRSSDRTSLSEGFASARANGYRTIADFIDRRLPASAASTALVQESR